jgi:PAS domain S-box-containing protein
MRRPSKAQLRLPAILLAALALGAATTVPFLVFSEGYPWIAAVPPIAVAVALAWLLGRRYARSKRERELVAEALAAVERTTFDALVAVDEEEAVSALNPAAEPLVAPAAGEPGEATRTLADLAGDDQARDALRELVTGRDGDDARGVQEALLRKADGTRALFRLRGATVGRPHGPARVLLAASEIDELRRTRAEFREARAKYEGMLQQAPVVTYVHGLGGRSAPVYVSPQVRALLGYEPDECVGRPLLLVEAVHPDDREKVERVVAAADGRAFRTEYRLVSRSGRIVEVAEVAVTIPDENGRPALTQGCLVDLSERRRAEEERRRLLEREGAAREELRKQLTGRQDALDLLTEAGRLLGSPPESGMGIERLAALTTQGFADWCVVDLVEDDGHAKRVITQHGFPRPPVSTDPAPNVDADSLAVARTGRAVLEPHRISVPLRARGRAVGVMTFVATAPGRTYGTLELALAEHLAGLAGLTVDSGRLYRQVQEGAEAAQVLTYVGDAVVLVDQAGLVRLWNPAAEAALLVPAEEVVGRTPAEVIPGWTTLSDRIPVSAAPDPGEPATLPIETSQGERWISISGVQYFGGTVYAFRDVTDAHRLDELKAEFVSTASHELRTPLAAVYGAAQTLRRHDFALDESGRERFIALIVEESDRLSRIVNEILLANQLDAGRLDLFTETFDPSELVERVAESARTRAPESVPIVLDVPGALPPVAADRDKARQVLVNLVENAVKYSPDGGEIEVGVRAGPSTVHFFVRDHGLGIPAQEQSRIFDKFYRLDPDMTRGVGGTGLGLYICRELVERMGGQISVASEPGEGSTFTFDLPRAETLASRPGVVEDRTRSLPADARA